MFTLLALVAGCATTAAAHRVETDGELPVSVIEAAPDGVPVSATATVQSGRVSSTVTVSVGTRAPVYMAPVSDRAAAAAAYRQQWLAENGGVPGARPAVVYVSPGTVQTATGAVKCPERLEDIDTLEERVACLEEDVDYIIGAVGVQ
jgi:hypothetical protein